MSSAMISYIVVQVWGNVKRNFWKNVRFLKFSLTHWQLLSKLGNLPILPEFEYAGIALISVSIFHRTGHTALHFLPKTSLGAFR